MSSKELPIFSPSFTRAYDFCPVKAVVERLEGLAPTIADRGLVSRISGTAFHTGAAIIHRMLRDNADGYPFITVFDKGVNRQEKYKEELKKICDAAETTYKSLFSAYVNSGGVIQDSEYQLALDRLKGALHKYAINTPLISWKKITHIEKQYPEHGNAILDVAGESFEGIPTVVDIKFTGYLESYSHTKRIKSYEGDWKLHHYVWAEYPMQTARAEILLIVAAPSFKILSTNWDVTPKDTAVWLSSAEAKWKRMEASRGKPPQELEMSATHADMYGPCYLSDWCLKMKRMGSLPTELIKVKWPKHIETE